MGDHAKKNETKSESELKMNVLIHHERIKQLEERIIRMERAFDALGRRLEGSERHVEDEGWFD
jgi:predicted RNase H-like nuclease (RuvC/YqgF family)